MIVDCHIAKTNKQRWRLGNNCAIVSRSGYIWIWSGARDQESTNHSAHFVEWKSSYITMGIAILADVMYLANQSMQKICSLAQSTYWCKIHLHLTRSELQLLYSSTQICFPIGGERVTCCWSKLTNFLQGTKLTYSPGKHQIELLTRTWSPLAPWNHSKFVKKSQPVSSNLFHCIFLFLSRVV